MLLFFLFGLLFVCFFLGGVVMFFCFVSAIFEGKEWFYTHVNYQC